MYCSLDKISVADTPTAQNGIYHKNDKEWQHSISCCPLARMAVFINSPTSYHRDSFVGLLQTARPPQTCWANEAGCRLINTYFWNVIKTITTSPVVSWKSLPLYNMPVLVRSYVSARKHAHEDRSSGNLLMMIVVLVKDCTKDTTRFSVLKKQNDRRKKCFHYKSIIHSLNFSTTY